MKEFFLPYKLSLIAKDKGFDNECIGVYNPVGKFIPVDVYGDDESSKNSTLNMHFISAPLYQQIVEWFTKEHSIVFIPEYDFIRDNNTTEYSYYYRLRKVQGVEEIITDKATITIKSSKEEFDLVGLSREALNKAIENAFKLI